MCWIGALLNTIMEQSCFIHSSGIILYFIGKSEELHTEQQENNIGDSRWHERKIVVHQYQAGNSSTNQQLLPMTLNTDEHLSISALETWLWDAACVIRGTN